MVKDTVSLICTYHTMAYTDAAKKSKMWIIISYQFQVVCPCHVRDMIIGYWPF